mgnify:CR=1 FL=1
MSFAFKIKVIKTILVSKCYNLFIFYFIYLILCSLNINKIVEYEVLMLAYHPGFSLETLNLEHVKP